MSAKAIAKALGRTLWAQVTDNIGLIAGPMLKPYVVKLLPSSRSSPLLSSRFLSSIQIDGAVTGGLVPGNAYAKYALPKGLPTVGKRTLAIENDPHTIDNFDGRIDKGYGKGVKTLINKEMVVVKLEGKTYLGKMNYHFHEADKAGPHYDLVVEGIPPGTKQFEISIPRGPAMGRYAFVTTDRGMIVTPMKDYGVTIAKPKYILKDVDFLNNLDSKYIVEQKLDGSLGDVLIRPGRAYFRSHRDGVSTYFDKLPALEFLYNTSPLFVWRKAAPNLGLTNSVFQGELVHPDGVSRVSGILNAYPALARRTQEIRGPVTFHIWDVVKLNGRDVTRRPYADRRKICEEAVADIRLFNKNWNVVAKNPRDISPLDWYNQIIDLPLPYGEGVVVKDGTAPSGTSYYKVKRHDLVDLWIVPGGFVEAQAGITGKYVGMLGSIVAHSSDPNANNGLSNENLEVVIGSGFTDYERDWIWRNRAFLDGAVIKARVFDTTAGSFRAPRFVEFHESKGNNEAGLLMYSEALAGMDLKDSKSALYALKSSAGWRK